MSFDAEVKVGEVRVFADTKEPLIALILEAKGVVGLRIVSVDAFLRHFAECRRDSVTLWRSYGGWSIAAAVMIGLGVVWMLTRDDVGPEGPRPDAPQIVKGEPSPEVHKAPEVGKMVPAAETRLSPLRSDAVVAGRKNAGAREPEVVRTLEWLKSMQKGDGSWGERPLKDTALAVIALMAHGETADSAAYGKTLVNGVRFLAEAKLDGHRRGEVQIVACALCGASAAVRNPNVRVAAERALAAAGENRSVEAGRDWRGLLIDLATPVAPLTSRATNVAAGTSEKDDVADACVLVLQLLAE